MKYLITVKIVKNQLKLLLLPYLDNLRVDVLDFHYVFFILKI